MEYTLGLVGREYISDLKEIYSLSFNDSSEYVDFFFEKMFDKCISVGAFENGRVIAAQYLMPCSFEGRKAFYGYALATHPDYRGRGICRDMQKMLMKALYEKDIFYFLTPASESLSDYYKKIGFSEGLRCGFYECTAEALYKPQKISAEEYVNERDRILSKEYGRAYVKWEPYMLSDFYDFYKSEGKYFAVSYVNESLYIAEFLGNAYDAERILKRLDFESAKKIYAVISS